MGSTLAEGVSVADAHSPGLEAEGDAFDAWVGPYLPDMTRLAAVLAGWTDREDVVQDALVRAWVKRHTFSPVRGTVRTWLLAIVKDQARRRRVRGKPGDAFAPERATHSDPDRDLDLERAIGRLPRRQRLAVELHYYVGLDVLECASLMGCAEGTVKATLHQARANLRRHLGTEAP